MDILVLCHTLMLTIQGVVMTKGLFHITASIWEATLSHIVQHDKIYILCLRKLTHIGQHEKI